VSPPNDSGPVNDRATHHAADKQADSQQLTACDDLVAWVAACCGDQTGKLFAALGRDPHWTADRYETQFVSASVDYHPGDDIEADKLIEASQNADMWMCPNLFYKDRVPGSLVGCTEAAYAAR
jgi:hypothetical protein